MKKDVNDEISSQLDTQLSTQDINITDVIDKDFLQEFQDTFAISTGVGSVFFDNKMNRITKESNFGSLCNDFFRKCEKSCQSCIKSDTKLISTIASTQKPFISYCENGLIDFGTPVLLDRITIGTLVAGQVFIKPPDREYYREYAKTIGADVDAFMEALEKVPVIPEPRVNAMLRNLTLVAEKLSQMGYQRLMIKQYTERLNDNIMSMMANTEEVTASASEVSSSQQLLNKEIGNITKLSGEINSVVGLINSIGSHTKLLGLNASIEAARAGDAGRGFSIVAKEIQKLSLESNNAVSKIKEFTSQINNNVKETANLSSSTLEVSGQQEQAMKSILELIENISNLAKKLNIMANEGQKNNTKI